MEDKLLQMVSKDQHTAFIAIYDRYKVAMLAYASKRIPISIAEDLVHDVFIKLWNNRESIEFSDKFSGYLFKSLRNIMIDYMAKDDRSKQYIDSLALYAIDFVYNKTDDRIREELFLKNIYNLLSGFSPQYISIFELRFQGYSNTEIAEKLGISEKTVRNKYAILTSYLRDHLVLLLLLFIKN